MSAGLAVSPIAIVGMACVFPGAHSPGDLWENVLAGRRYFRRMPPERLPRDDYFDTIAGLVHLARPLKVVVDASNGMAGKMIPAVFHAESLMGGARTANQDRRLARIVGRCNDLPGEILREQDARGVRGEDDAVLDAHRMARKVTRGGRTARCRIDARCPRWESSFPDRGDAEPDGARRAHRGVLLGVIAFGDEYRAGDAMAGELVRAEQSGWPAADDRDARG